MLKIARGLELDPDYYGGGTFALLGKKGAGKSFAARVLAEELWKARLPFVKFDPMGVAWGLRSSAEGRSSGIPVPIFGGKHGDAPLERTGGAVLADLVVQDGLSMVLDMSGLGSHAAEREFALTFLERLYRTNERLVHLLIDEADMFAPQSKHHGDERLLGVMENIVRRGRNRGIGCTMLTQRPAVLNKDVLTQVDGLALLRITSPQDRSAADEWMKGHADQAQAAAVKASLASLSNGESWWWIPELDVLKRTQIRRSRTFDSSPTRRREERREPPKSLAEVDLAAITERMAATVERAKREDPRELRRRIAELEREVVEARENLLNTTTPEPEVVEVVRVPPGLNGELAGIHTLAAELAEKAEGLTTRAKLARTHVQEAEAAPAERPVPPAPRRTTVPPAVERPAPQHARSVSQGASSSNGEVTLKRMERKVLGVLAQFPEGRTHTQLAMLAGYSSKSGGFKTALSTLRSAELMDRGDPIRITQAGLAAIEGQYEPLPSGEALFEHWLGHLKLMERTILQALREQEREGFTMDELADATGYSSGSGGFKTALSKLRTLQLITKGQPIYLAPDFADAVR